jgi:hypothetical protein
MLASMRNRHSGQVVASVGLTGEAPNKQYRVFVVHLLPCHLGYA